MSSFLNSIKNAKSVREQLELLTEELAILFQPIKILVKLSDSGFNFLCPPLEWSSEIYDTLVDDDQISSLALLTELKNKRTLSDYGLKLTDLSSCKLYSIISDYQGIPEIDICIVRLDDFNEHEVEKLQALLTQTASLVRKSRLELLSIKKSSPSENSNKSNITRVNLVEAKFADAGVLKIEVNKECFVISSNFRSEDLSIFEFEKEGLRDTLKVSHSDLKKAISKVSSETPILLQRISLKVFGESKIYLIRLSYDVDSNTITCIGTDVTAEHRLSSLTRRQEDGYSAISKVVLASGESENLEDYLKQVLPLLSGALDAKAGLILVEEKNASSQAIISSFNIEKSEIELAAGSEFSALIDWAKRSNEVVVIPHLAKKGGVFKFLDKDLTPANCVICPLTFSSSLLGVVILVYPFKGISFDDSFLILVKTVVAHISGAVVQMQLLEETKSKQRVIQALYRLSHELSRFLSLEQIFQKSFEIMQSELGIERFWVGLLNETNTRLVGSSAYGEGWKKKLVEVNIDISSESHPLADVIKKKKPLLLQNAGDILNALGVKRFIIKNEIDSIGIIPLLAGGQVLGVLAFEGERFGKPLSNEDLNILSSFAAELASVLLSKKLEERVTAGETMRASGLLAAGIAHNFNNLLQGILGQASLLDLYSNKPEQVQKSAKLISEASAKGASLVKQLMSFAHLEEPQGEDLDVNSMVERNKASFQRILRDRQYIVYNLSGDLPKTYADPSQVLRIMQVLVSNAKDAMEADGRLELVTDFVEIDKNSPHYEVPYGRYVRIGVRDDGVGMDLETRRRCFEPFFTTKNVDPSSGLSLSGEGMGLAAGFALAKKNGGRLVVDSRKGHGSLFTLYLPIDQSKLSISRKEKLRDELVIEAVPNFNVDDSTKEVPLTAKTNRRLSSKNND